MFSVVFFLLCLNLLILSLPLLALGSQYTSVNPGLCVHESIQYNLLGVWSFFRIFCFFLVDCLGRWNYLMWLVSCRKQEIPTSRDHNRPQVYVEYFITRYTSTSIRLIHLCQGYHDHCGFTGNDRGCKGWGWLIIVKVWVSEQGMGITCFVLFLCYCSLLFHDWCTTFLVSSFVFLFCLPCLWSL